MEYAIIGLLSVAIILLLISFTGKDRVKKLEEQFDQLSLSVIQETYLIKKKVKILEEELLTNDIDFELDLPTTSKTNSSVDASILSLYEAGLSYEQIARKVNMPTEEVRLILEHARKMGLS
ncbi:hypothetical protein [Fredinandcohnia sp. 179-A 10B2 NHS]|uniref:hypothetical protein n=1 Tax=Fredinandcohnia sp. 179-A 10B2 NHS TaxID=3235176 RepID=UPI00399F3018